jgi:hypothetical protein
MLVLTITFCSNSKYSNILNQFIELNNELGNPGEDVGVIISNVRNVINDEEKKTSAVYSALSQICTSIVASVTGAINHLGNDVTESTKNLNEWNVALAASVKDIVKAENDIKTTTANLHTNRIAVSRALEDFKVIATETDQKLNVVKVLKDIITDELINHAHPAHGHSFIQLTKFTDKLNELKGMLNSENDSLYTPLVSVLLELASEQNFSDQGILKKILENINALENNLKAFRKNRDAGLNAELKTLRATSVNLAKIRTAYENMRAQSFSKRIDAQHYIHFYTNEIAHFNAEKNRKNEELHLVEKICGFEKKLQVQDSEGLARFKKDVLPYIVEQIQKLQH